MIIELHQQDIKQADNAAACFLTHLAQSNIITLCQEHASNLCSHRETTFWPIQVKYSECYHLTKINNAIGPSGLLDQLLKKSCDILTCISQGHMRIHDYSLHIFITENEI